MDILNHTASFVCHQDPARTISIGTRLLPLCARCTGIYASFIFVLLGLVLISRTRRWLLSRPVEALPGVGLLFAGLALTAIETRKLFSVSLTGRLFVGAAMGTGLALILFPIFNQLVLRRKEGTRAHFEAFAISLAWFALLALGAASAAEPLYYVLYASSIAGIAALYIVTNINVASLVLEWSPSGTSSGGIVNMAALTAILILIEVLIISFLRVT